MAIVMIVMMAFVFSGHMPGMHAEAQHHAHAAAAEAPAPVLWQEKGAP